MNFLKVAVIFASLSLYAGAAKMPEAPHAEDTEDAQAAVATPVRPAVETPFIPAKKTLGEHVGACMVGRPDMATAMNPMDL